MLAETTVTAGAGMLTVAAATGLAATVKKAYDLSKQVANQNWHDVVAQLLAWGLGVLVVWAWSKSDIYGAAVQLPGSGNTLASADLWSVIVIGVTAGSTGGVLFSDIPKAIDRTQTAAMPKLFPGDNDPLATVPPVAPPVPVQTVGQVGVPAHFPQWPSD